MRRLAALGLLCGCLLGKPALAQVEASDDAGQSLRLTQPAARIVALSPHAVELLYAAGAGDRVVAAVEYSDYPEAARKLPRVGSFAALDLERIARLKPDLAVAWGSGNPPAQVAQLARFGIPVFVSEPKKLEDIPASLRRLGRLAGTAEAAEIAARDFERRHAALRGKYAGRRSVAVFYEIWNQPLMTIGGDHVISAAIELCGGRNVFAGLTQPAETVELEAVLRLNPEAIVSGGMETVRREWLEQWRRWPQLAAVQRDNLFVVPPDLLQRHTPRLLDGAERLCGALEIARQKTPAAPTAANPGRPLPQQGGRGPGAGPQTGK